MREIRVAEVLGALSLTTDLATGAPFEKGLQVALVAVGLGRLAGLGPQASASLLQTALLRSVGCTAHAPENAAEFGDDTSFQRIFRRLDPADPEVFAEQLAGFGSWAGEEAAPGLARRFLEIAPTVGPYAVTALCEVSRALAPALGATPEVLDALEDVYERWDGLGIPRGRSGEQVALPIRLVHVAEEAVTEAAQGGLAQARAEVRRRAGGHLDPALAALFDAHADRLLAPLSAADPLAEVLLAEPRPWACVPVDRLDRLCAALGLVADLKSTFLLGHSAHVAEVAGEAAAVFGLGPEETRSVRCAALLHNLGSVVVPSALLDRAGGLGAAERERLRLQGHWTRRILQRCPALTDLDPVARAASAHHAAFAEGGFLTWRRDPDLPAPLQLPAPAAVLEAAEVWASFTEPRPGRPAQPAATAESRLLAAAEGGLLEPGAVAAVLQVTGDRGLATTRSSPPTPRARALTDREVEVLRLAARGLTNREIAQELAISERTVGHHLAHVYDKTGRRTRAGVAVWAVQNGMLPARR